MILLFIEIILLIISAYVGAMGSTISWGNPNGFHGTGWPVPIVSWDNGLPYFSPVGWVVNPLGATLLMLALIIVHRIFRRILKRTWRRKI